MLRIRAAVFLLNKTPNVQISRSFRQTDEHGRSLLAAGVRTEALFVHTDAGECAGNTNTQTYSKTIDHLNICLDKLVQAQHLDQIMAVMRKTKSFDGPCFAAS